MLAVFLTLAPFVGGPVVAAQCDSCVLDFTGGTQQVPFTFATTVGWKFTVGSGFTITIEGLGLFDFGANGLAEDHQIALWKSDTSLLALTTIKADGSNSTPVASTSADGNWRSTPITSLKLTAGDYVVGASYAASSADTFMKGATASTIKGVTWDEYRGGKGTAFPPTFTGEGGNGFFGPNLFIAAAPPVPEPKTYAMLMAGLGLLGLIARRRRKSLNAAA